MEKLLEDVSFDASERSGAHIAIDAAYVNAHLSEIARDNDLSRFIL